MKEKRQQLPSLLVMTLVRSDLMIKYTPDETSSGTSYLKADGVGNGDNVTRTAELDFEQVNSRWGS